MADTSSESSSERNNNNNDLARREAAMLGLKFPDMDVLEVSDTSVGLPKEVQPRTKTLAEVAPLVTADQEPTTEYLGVTWSLDKTGRKPKYVLEVDSPENRAKIGLGPLTNADYTQAAKCCEERIAQELSKMDQAAEAFAAYRAIQDRFLALVEELGPLEKCAETAQYELASLPRRRARVQVLQEQLEFLHSKMAKQPTAAGEASAKPPAAKRPTKRAREPAVESDAKRIDINEVDPIEE